MLPGLMAHVCFVACGMVMLAYSGLHKNDMLHDLISVCCIYARHARHQTHHWFHLGRSSSVYLQPVYLFIV